MSEYYLITSSGPCAMTEVSDHDKRYINYKECARPPIEPIRIYETYKPEDEYQTPEFVRTKVIALSKRVVIEAGLQYIYGINWVPAHITNANGRRDYLFINYLQELKCADVEKSKYSYIDSMGGLTGLEKLVLDEALLAQTPLNQRLIFMMAESARILFHRSIVERIMATNPINTTFKPCEQFA
ncbi:MULTISPECIES: hypothetical protein [Shewanella]|jgi:hypothetical protein|uniref:hypothetical protein n=1 Tax=Shewanella TaxID=22 RepID=UPI0014309BFF|nr:MULTISPECIES: hypothetical protein [Shewanella]MBO2693346.1 hypothetical protein [Shewanella algae]MDC8853614.1 hypothetical protein [Shewanella algae]MDO8253441.1 hypothetical protein [Shewanella algae]NJI86622.1 hypothetical protein [Shewanella sp. Iso12]QTE89975.1 hypothetical protein JKK33_16645 [Shewanella algae]